MNSKKKNWKTIAEFFGHMLTGVAIFAVVGAGSVALHFVVEWLVSMGVGGVTITLLKAVDLLFSVTDVICLVAWAYVSTAKALREMFKDKEDEDGDE